MRWSCFVLVVVQCTWLVATVKASCECGYVDETGKRWMDALILPFDQIADFNNSPDVYLDDYVHNKAFGNYSYHLNPKNVNKDDGGNLQLWVRPPTGDIVESSQLSLRRRDILYGTFRATMMMPAESGTCAGFFYYFNDSQEIDIEYLGQKNTMLYVSSKTIPLPDFKANTWENVRLTSPIAGVYKEYRFDWLPERVDFFMDGKHISTLPASPSEPGKVMLMNWSSGDPNWSGTPSTDVVMGVRNVVMFFNSSHSVINQNFATVCTRHASRMDATCNVADISSNVLYGYAQNVIRISVPSSSAQTTSSGQGRIFLSLGLALLGLLVFTY